MGFPKTKKARKNPSPRPSMTARPSQALERSPKNKPLFCQDLQCDFGGSPLQAHRGIAPTLGGFVVSHFSVRRNFITCWNLIKAQTSSVCTMAFHPDVLLCKYFCSSVCFAFKNVFLTLFLTGGSISSLASGKVQILALFSIVKGLLLNYCIIIWSKIIPFMREISLF